MEVPVKALAITSRNWPITCVTAMQIDFMNQREVPMFGKLFGWGQKDGPSAPFYRPYKDQAADFLYNLLFCDNPGLFRTDKQDASSLAMVLSVATTREMLEKIAGDPAVESRVRMLAFNRLRAMKLPAPAKQLLGTIIEFPQDNGLDTLAAFAGGRVRYINQTGKPAIFEGAPPEIVAKANELMRVSQFAVDRHGPSDEPRRPPPAGDLVRVSFLVSDGLYFGEGSFEVLIDDPEGGPVLTAGGELLAQLVDTVLETQTKPGSRA
jgi:hypothetical protein